MGIPQGSMFFVNPFIPPIGAMRQSGAIHMEASDGLLDELNRPLSYLIRPIRAHPRLGHGTPSACMFIRADQRPTTN